MKKIFLITLIIPLISSAQIDSTFYSTGELFHVTYLNKTKTKKSTRYFYKSGNCQAEMFFDNRGVLIDAYQLSKKGDTIKKSNVPKFNSQPKIDLSFLNWTKTKFGNYISITQESNGQKIKKGDSLEVWYIGYFKDGSQFDNSDISKIKLNLIIGEGSILKSFQDGLLEFRIGSSGYIKISSNLAYGDKIMGNIPANSDLIYYVKPKKSR